MGVEFSIEREVIKYAESRGWLVRKVKYIGRDGAPDRWLLRDGKWLVIEFKAPGEKPNIQQRREHDRLRRKGQAVHVCDNIDSGKWLIDAHTS